MQFSVNTVTKGWCQCHHPEYLISPYFTPFIGVYTEFGIHPFQNEATLHEHRHDLREQFLLYAKGAADAASFASLCVELNIPIETGAGASLSTAMGDGGSGKYMGRTFRSTGNVAMRAMYAFQKYMSYNLEVTDKIFEGGTNAAISESLNNLKNANLTEEQIAQLSEFTANRRTFKDATWKDSDGKTRGSDLSRAAAGFKRGAGDIFGKPGEVGCFLCCLGYWLTRML